MRDGLVANYPTVKNLVQGAMLEVDSNVTVTISKTDNAELFNLLSTDSKTETAEVTIPYYGRYGIDLSARNFRLFRDGEKVDVALPPVRLLYCELKFDRMLLNGKPAVAALRNDNTPVMKSKMYELLIPLLGKNKSAQKVAKTVIAKALMYYFIPYKFDLQLYIAEQLQELPLLPGVNQTVDEAINQMLGK